MDQSAVYRRRVQFRVLGPLEVDAGEGPVPLGGRKQRAVLASLLVRANEVVSADALIHDVWGENAPDTARNILQTYVANLRKAVGDERLTGRPPGYVLSVGPAELDAARFDALVAEAKKSLAVDPKVAIATFEDALALWRGPALADLHDHSPLLAEAARLDELRLDAQEDRIEALLATGANARALAELDPLLARDPLRESLWGLAMIASYRDGRQADALNAYGRARELLADELGIDPSPELARLHERILKQDPGLELRGEPLRGYRLLERIGVGPLGSVFRGIQPHVGRDVAVKVFDERFAADPDLIARFERQAQVIAALEHPHIVPMYDYWREPGRAYVVSRYMRGGSLRALLERGDALGRERKLGIIAQTASALGFAQRQGVAHGGVGPSNVLLDPEGNAYLADFWIGAGREPSAGEDLAAFRRWSLELLAGDLPEALGDVLGDPLAGTTAVIDADTIADAVRENLKPRAEAVARAHTERNPYKGLRAFTEADAQDFFGRGDLTDGLIARLNYPGASSGFLAVVGPSGGGKSSAVRAGLVPAIRAGALVGAGRVLVADMFPGVHPLDELEAALVRVAARPHAQMGERLRSESRGLLDAVEFVTPEDATLVLVIDQFEELFTLTKDEREREHFLESLRVAAVDPSSRLRVVATLRADFLDRPLVYPRFGELLAERNVTMPPLTPDELEQAIRRPAERQGVQLESGLVAEMIADVVHEPGGLPLLQYALTELFERRDDDRLTVSVYQEIGGVTGALSARADRLYTTADHDGRRAIEQVFLRLVTLGEGRQDTRRRVTIAEMDALDVSDTAVAAALEMYGRHRLLTFDREPATREPTVEIAHEALLPAWERLESWIDRAREDIRQNERLTRAAAEWRGSERDPSFLMSGGRLEQVEGWAQTTSLSVAQPERAYLKASVEQRDRARIEEQARLDREAQIERRSVRRLRGLVAVFAVAALVAGSLTIVATRQSGRAEREARTALARELTAASVSNLDEDPERSILLAIEAVRTTRSVDGIVLPQAEEALHRAVVASRITRSLDGVGGRIAWGATGVFAAEASPKSGVVELRDAETGEIVRSFQGHDADITGFAFSRDGTLLATTGWDGLLKIWDPSTGALVGSVEGQGAAWDPSFDGDGGIVGAIWTKEGLARVLDLSTDRVGTVHGSRTSRTLAISPDGTRIAMADGGSFIASNGDFTDPFVIVKRIRDDEEVLRFGAPTGFPPSTLTWSPDGRFIAGGELPHVWDARTGKIRTILFGHTDDVMDIVWSDDSSRVVTGSFDGTAKVWSRSHGDVFREFLTLNNEDIAVVAGVAISADGTRVMAGDESEDALAIWDIGRNGDTEWANVSTGRGYDVAFDASGSLFVAEDGGRVTIWDPGRTGALLDSFDSLGRGCCVMGIDLSSDGSTIAIGYWGGVVSVRNVATGAELLRVDPMAEEDRLTPAFDLSDAGDLLAVARAGTVHVMDLTGSDVRVLSEDGFDLGGPRFSPDGRLLVTAPVPFLPPDQVVLRIWEWRKGRIVTTIPTGADSGSGVVFDQTGRLLATYSHLGRPDIWNVRTGKPALTLSGQQGDLYAIAFSPDGSRFATGSSDGTVRLFDTISGRQTLVLHGPSRVLGISFSADGSMLASVTKDEGVRVWALDVDDLLEIARRNVTRSLTEEECRQYGIDPCPG